MTLTPPGQRGLLAGGHRDLLVAHGLPHLDLHEITTSRRAITQEIAAELYDRGAAGVRFPSRPEGAQLGSARLAWATRVANTNGPLRWIRPSA